VECGLVYEHLEGFFPFQNMHVDDVYRKSVQQNRANSFNLKSAGKLKLTLDWTI
jgi:hypothetical protein